MRNLLLFIVLGFLFLMCETNTSSYQYHGTLKVSKNKHYLVSSDNTPFLWLGDTGWAIFQKLTRKEVDFYLENRAEKGFNVIQAVVYWYPHGGEKPLGPLNEANAYGHRPFTGTKDSPNTSQPLLQDGGKLNQPNDYWDHADYIIKAAKERGVYLALLPCWGNAYINNRMQGSQIEFTETEAREYGHFLGSRYKNDSHIIWVMGGDVDPVNFGDKDQRAVYRAMAEGIGRGVSGNCELKWNEAHPDWDKTFMTFHAVQTPNLSGGKGGSSSLWFHNDAWMDVNMMETFAWTERIYPLVEKDYMLNPTKPTILGEGAYEGGKYGHDCGWITPLKVRQQAYHSFFAGAAGHTYGYWAIWPFRDEYCGETWDQVLNAPGAYQIANILKRFLIENEWYKFTPKQELLLSQNVSPEQLVCAMLGENSDKALFYFSQPTICEIDLDLINGKQSAIWFNPENGDEELAKFQNPFIPPKGWQDAVLIIE